MEVLILYTAVIELPQFFPHFQPLTSGVKCRYFSPLAHEQVKCPEGWVGGGRGGGGGEQVDVYDQ